MTQLTYNIPNDKVAQIAEDWIYLYPNTEREVKDGVDPADIPEGTLQSDDTWYQDRWTDNQWVREHIKRWANQQLKRSRQKQARDAVGNQTEGEIT